MRSSRRGPPAPGERAGPTLSGALADEEVRLPAIFTFVTTASGITIAGLGGPFWGLLGGIAILLLLRTGRITAR